MVNILIRSIVAALLFLCVSPIDVRAEDSETVYYSQITGTIPDGTGNTAITVEGYTFGIGRNGLKMGKADIQNGQLKVTYDNYLRLESASEGFQIYSEGMNKRYLVVDEQTGRITVSSASSSGHWEYKESHLFYVTENKKYAITGADANGLTVGEVSQSNGLTMNRGAAQQEEEPAITESKENQIEEKREVIPDGEEKKTEETIIPDSDEQEKKLPEEKADPKEEPLSLEGEVKQEEAVGKIETEPAVPEYQEILEQTDSSMTGGGAHAGASVFRSGFRLTAAAGENPAAVYFYTGTRAPSRPGPGPGPGGRTEDMKPVFVTMPAAYHYVLEGSEYEAPTYEAEVKCGKECPEGDFTLQWYFEGNPYGDPVTKHLLQNASISSSVTIPQLKDKKDNCGVYSIKCTATVKMSDNSTYISDVYTNFIVAKGVQPDSMLTFSDVHGDFDQIGNAINDIMITTGGYLPSLVVATGDFSTNQYGGKDQGNIDTVLEQLIQRVRLQVAGIDTVWVSGNHDNGYAAALANTQGPMLGLNPSEYQNAAQEITGTGIIFDTRSADFAANAGTSKVTSGLIVIGVNYEDLSSPGAAAGITPPSGGKVYNYGSEESTGTVYQYLKNALERVAENYNGELVVISAHAGLHALGVDPDSTGVRDGEWAGSANYNIRNSDAVTRLINEYAKKYNMDIMFLFGHDHSRGESEFIKASNDEIDTVVFYSDHSNHESKRMTLEFTYAHAGYITGSIGGQKRYTYLTWNENKIQRDMKTAGKGKSVLPGLTRTISRRYRKPEETKEETKQDETRYSVNPYSGVVTCQMAGYTENYAWNEAAKACQPGYIDDFGVFHSLAESSARYYVPNTADTYH